MAFNYSPKIVTDGLVLYLDAANTRSYPGTGTTWSDLSRGGNNGTLINGPTFNAGNGGSIVFDGTNDRVSKIGAINTGQNFTVNAWIYQISLIGQKAIIGNDYPYSLRNGWLLAVASYTGNPNTFFLSIGSDMAYRVSAANTLTLNTWQYITAVVTNGGGTITLYLNGNTTNTYVSSISPGTITYPNIEFHVGMRSTSDPKYFSGNIAQTSIYNRALTQQEILQNYNATKTRFGL